MKKKINQMLALVAALAIFLAMGLATLTYYGMFRKQMMEDLRTCAELLCAYGEPEVSQLETGGGKDSGIRITLISPEGQVLYDSQADPAKMDNHSYRPEIAEAMEKGEGQEIRISETLSESTFYYACKLESGRVLRVAKDTGSLFGVLLDMLPGMFLEILLLLIVCLLVGRILVRKFVAPIRKLAENPGGYEEESGYGELEAFIRTIRQQHKDLLRNAKIRQEFTANVTHELKTPLTSISGYAELIENGMASDEDVTRFALGIRKSANRLLTLINDIIRLSELDSTEEELMMEEENLYELAKACVEMLDMNAEKHQVTISLEGEPCVVCGNRQMLEELLYNLCDNAIRYNNPGGSVLVSVFPRDGDVVLCVKDTGIGIPKEHQDRIFERFYRVDKSRSKSTGGTGLGLAIVKHIISRHEAYMELDSETGKGTAIRVIF